jgi:ABC-type sugar transport system substrate-binding protein
MAKRSVLVVLLAIALSLFTFGLAACSGGKSDDGGNSADKPESNGATIVENQGIPADWEEVVALPESMGGENINALEWFAAHKDLKAKSKYRIASIQYSQSNEFPVLLAEATKYRGDQLDITVDIFDSENDTNIEIQNFENAIANGYDAIVFSPVDSAGSSAGVKKANEAGIPVIDINTCIQEFDTLDGFVGSDCVQSGEILMEYLAETAKGTGNVVMLWGPFAQSASFERAQGIINVIRNNPDMNIIADDAANWSRSEALDLMTNWLNANPDQINIIAGQNDEMALGALQAVKAAGVDGIVAGGIDGIADALDAVENGEMACTVLQDAVAQGAIGIDLAVLKLNGEDFGEHFKWVAYELVTKDTVPDYRTRTDIHILDK